MTNLQQTPLTCSGHTRPVVDLSFSDVTADGYFMVSACKDGKPMLRQGDTGDWVGTFDGHKGAVWGVAINADSTMVATGAADFSAKVWNAQTGTETMSFTHKHVVKSVDFTSSSSHLLTGSNEKILRVFDLTRPDAEAQQFLGHTANIKRVVFLPGDRTFISSSDDKTLRVWDCRTGQAARCVELCDVASDIEISVDGRTMTLAYGTTVGFRNTDSLDEFRAFKIPTEVNSASLHPDQTVFVCGGENFIMYKFSYSTGEKVEDCKGHFGPVHVVRFSPDGELYASGSEDGTLRLWQTEVGKTYGLWKCADSPVTSANTAVTAA